ncbi:MAG: isoprenylcysteine carboxylmethyltransferase family protein [Spirochaetia bacterium]|jgi:protein-S-isoprenylcysteine O-methyltransferase Ste14
MGTLGYLTIALSIVWAIPEIRNTIRKRSSAPTAEKDRHSLLAVMAANYVSVALAVAIKLVPAAVGGIGGITMRSSILGYFGCLVMILGMVIRWRAITMLKQQFTIDVAIVEGHKLVDTGLYGVIRHPAYLGGQVTLLGLGLALENWLSLLILFILPLAAHLYRISVEEKVLVDHFGSSYSEYMKRTKRLIPGVF